MVYLCTIGSMDSLQRWIAEITENASWRSIAEQLGTTHPTVQRRLRDSTASTVIDLANAYGANPIPGLLAAKAITERQLDEYSREHDLSDYTDLELAQEIVSRLEVAAEHEVLTTPTDDLAPRRTDRGTQSDDEDYGEPHLYVADSSDYHEEENTEFDD